MTDAELVRAKLQALAGDRGGDPVVTVVHEEPPVTWQRAQYNRRTHRFFTDKRTRAGERSIGWAIAREMRGLQPFTDTVALFVIFYLADLRDRDTDNLVKLVMDGATKAKVWTDDALVRTHGVLIDLDYTRPRTVLAMCPYLCAHTAAPLLMGKD